MHVDNAETELLAKLRQLLEQSGEADGTVDFAAWLEAWLKDPSIELGGATPAQVMRTASGRRQLVTLLERMRGGLPG